MAEPLSVTTAIESLDRLKQAAPPATASRLGQIMALIQSLAADNAFLSAQVTEDADILQTLSPPPDVEDLPPPPPPPEPEFEPETGSQTHPADAPMSAEDITLDIVAGLNEALRVPLDAIRGRSEVIQSTLVDLMSEEQVQWLQAIDDNTDQAFLALDAVDRLVALIRHDVQINWANIITTELLEEAQNRIAERATQAKHQITIQVPDIVPLAYGDFYQSLLILNNMLDNAIRYTPPGGQIRLSVDNLGTHVLFSVSDNGIGLQPEDIEKVGKPFWRGDHHPLVRYNASGTGLSLFLAKQILALQDGELIFSGEPELGSTFSFTLPAPA